MSVYLSMYDKQCLIRVLMGMVCSADEFQLTVRDESAELSHNARQKWKIG